MVTPSGLSPTCLESRVRHSFNVVNLLSRWWRREGGPLSTDDARFRALETHVQSLYDHVQQTTRELQQLRQDEARRAAEHSTMVDSLTRLYKRVSARIVRDAENGHAAPPAGESVAELRRRLGR